MQEIESAAQGILENGDEHFRIGSGPQRVIFWLARSDGQCELVSHNWAELTGRNATDALGGGWMSAVSEPDRAGIAEELESAITEQRGFSCHYRLRCPDGSFRWVLHHVSPRLIPSGEFDGLIGTITDATDFYMEDAETDSTERRIYDFFDNVKLSAVAIDFCGRVVYCNRALAELLALSAEQIVGSDWTEAFVGPDDRDRIAALVDGRTESADLPADIEFGVETPAVRRLLRWHLTLIRDRDGRPKTLTFMGNDITRWRDLGNHSRLTAQMFEHSTEAMLITDRDNSIISVNASFSRLTGYSAEEAIGQNPRLLKSGRHPPEFYAVMWREIMESGHWCGDIWDRRKDGTCYPKFLAITVIPDANGVVTNFSGIFHDASGRKAIEERLDFLAHYDSLTLLPNRMLLQDRLEQAVAAAQRYDEHFALLFIDMDGFKEVNDEHGHLAGDDVLREVGQRLKAAVRGIDTAARLGGDEFVVILKDVRQADDATQVADKIVARLGEPFTLATDVEVTLSASVGISVYPQDETVAGKLLDYADQAMYDAKRNGKAQVRRYRGET